MKAVVIGDALVSSQTIKDAVRQMNFAQPIDEIEVFEWYSELSKDEFQKKIKIVESGPEGVDIPEGVLKALEDADYLFCHYSPVSKAMIEAGKNLKLIGTCRGGLENVNLTALRETNTQLIHVIRNAEPVAEFTIGLMLAETRNIARSYYAIKNGQWRKEFSNNPYKSTLKNQLVGVVGLGYIGKLVVKKLNALGVKVIAYDPYVNTEKLEKEGLLVTLVSIEQLFCEADIVSLHMRVTKETTNMINQSLIDLMKPGSYLVNTARPEILEKEALVNALQSNKIAGAALDVTWVEPIGPDDPMLKLDNITLTSHIAADTVDAIPKAPYLLKDVINDYLTKGFSEMIVS